MIKNVILKTLTAMAVLLSLTAAPALAEAKNGPLVLVGGDSMGGAVEGYIGKFDLQTAVSGGNNVPAPFTGEPYGRDPEVTPDGTAMVYTGDNRTALYRAPLDKHVAPTRITTDDQILPNATLEYPAVSPDGQTVYFQYTARDDDGNTLINDVYSVPIEGGDITRVTHDDTGHTGLEITPDGDHFVYSEPFFHVYIQPVSGGPATVLADCSLTACDPAVSADGTKIAFIDVDENEDVAIYTVPFSTTGGATPTKVAGSEVPLEWSISGHTGSVYSDLMVAYSPDGKYIAYSVVFQGFGVCPVTFCGPDEVLAETRTIPVGGGTHNSIQWGESNSQTQVAWAPASSDTNAPQFGPLPDITKEATSGAGATVTLSPGDRPTDDVDPNPVLSCTKVDSFGRRVNAFTSMFPIGTIRVTCTAEDASGNRSTAASFDVTVRDTTAPTITGMPSDIVKEDTGANGVRVSWTQPTATDIVSGSPFVYCTPDSHTIFPIGETTVGCTATDSRNNSTTKTFKVTVRDTTAPTISGVPNDISVTATSSSGRVVNYSLPTATDIADSNVNVECSPASGATFAPGETKVSCTATDDAGNTGEASFSVHVSYDWSGVLQPVNADGSSVFKLGTTVPVKFALRGDSAAVTDANAKLSVTKIDSGIEGTVSETVSTATATTGDLFRYDATKKQYVFNWGTKGLGQGTYKLSIDLGDGTVDDPQAKNHVLVSLKR